MVSCFFSEFAAICRDQRLSTREGESLKDNKVVVNNKTGGDGGEEEWLKIKGEGG